MYPCIKFELICPQNVSDKNFGKINNKFEMRM